MIEVTKIYQKEAVPSGLEIEFDNKHPGKPHWIWVKNFKDHPRFISVKTSQNSEHIYKAFGAFYYPIEDIPTQDVQRDLIAATAAHYDQIVGDLNPQIADFILGEVNKLKIPKTVKLLDVGSGTGITSRPFLKAGFNNITLLDASEEMITVAKNKPEFKAIKTVVSDVRTLNLPEKYDLVISSMMLCDLTEEELVTAVASLVKFLNPGAHVVLVEDEDREVYHKYFKTISSGMAPFNEYQKFYFVGKLCRGTDSNRHGV